MKKMVLALVLAGSLGLMGSSEAYVDTLGQPLQPPRQETGLVQVASPDAEVEQAFATWQQPVEGKRFLKNLRTRIRFYQESHQWTEDSPARQRLWDLYRDYEKLFQKEEHPAGEAMLGVLRQQAAQVTNSELRTYLNEAVLFGLQGETK